MKSKSRKFVGPESFFPNNSSMFHLEADFDEMIPLIEKELEEVKNKKKQNKKPKNEEANNEEMEA